MKKSTIHLLFMLCLWTVTQLQAQHYHAYVSDAGNFQNGPWKILKFDENGQNGEAFISSHLAWPQDIFFIEPKNEVLVSNLNSGLITRFNASTGAYINEFATGLKGPTRMKLGPDSLLYVLQWETPFTVLKYDLNGNFKGTATSTGTNTSIGIDWDAQGNLYVSSYNGKMVKKYTPNGTDLGAFINTNLAGPTNIWFDATGQLLVNDYNSGTVKRFSADGQYLGIVISNVPQVEGVTVLPDGNLLLGCGGLSSVRHYDSNFNLLGDFVPSGALGLKTPNAVIIRKDPSSAADEVQKEELFVQPTLGTVFQVGNAGVSTGPAILRVYNNAGLLAKEIKFVTGQTLDASDLPNGQYLLSVQWPDGKILSRKIVVQHP